MDIGHEIESGQIIIKDSKILIALMERRYHPLLIRIIADVAKQHGIVLTEAWREPPRHINDLHARGRAIDLRSWCYPDKLAYEIRHQINTRWEYDPQRPEKDCAIIHKVNGGALHFHIQVHPNTRRRAA